MLALPLLLEACLPSLRNLSFFTMLRSDSPLSCQGAALAYLDSSKLTTWIDGFVSFWQKRLWRTCQLLFVAILSFLDGPVCSSFMAETCKLSAGIGSTNKSLWQELTSLFSCSIRLGFRHSFLPSNDAADELARRGALLVPSPLIFRIHSSLFSDWKRTVSSEFFNTQVPSSCLQCPLHVVFAATYTAYCEALIFPELAESESFMQRLRTSVPGHL